MEFLNPGRFDIERSIAERAGFKPGMKILDVGCGLGDGDAFLKNELGLAVTGLDASPKVVRRAQERHPGLDIQYYNGYMLDFPSLTFDGAVLEFSLSLLERQEEILHELFCVLKHGGKLAICDLYCLNPDMDRARRERAEAMAIINRPRTEGDCENAPRLPPVYSMDGMLTLNFLYAALEELKLKVTYFEDRTPELRAHVEKGLAAHGSFNEVFKAALHEKAVEREFCDLVKYSENTGCFLLIAENK